MRVSRAIKLITVSGFLSSLATICVWSLIQNDEQYESNQGDYILTEYHNRAAQSYNGAGTFSQKTGNNSQSLVFDPNGGETKVQVLNDIECVINDERVLKCKKEDNQVYMPFDFIKEYFEVYGDIKGGEDDGKEQLLFQHANSIVHPPRPTYKPSSMFMAFDHYNVENRDRVKCVTASEGVPLTTQWNKDGYHYPIQIAQFALSHHAKFIAESDLGIEQQRHVLEDGEDDVISGWNLPDQTSWYKQVKDPDNDHNHVMEFSTSDSIQAKGVSIKQNERKLACLLIDLKFVTNGSVTVVVESVKNVQFKIHYIFSSRIVHFDGKQNIYYGMGTGRSGQWIRLVRNLRFDLLKGLLVKMKLERARMFPMNKIAEIRVNGRGMLDNLTVAQSVHMEQFYDAANWLVRHQDDRGGWPIMVHRRIVVGVLELAPGWYSAMGQGQAMSVLVRAYLDSKESKYLDAAVRALELFQVDSAEGGVRACFFGKYYWYEEYPTTPSSFVLNGFIYSLLGLYDLKETAVGEDQVTAEKIYNHGMASLKHMIGMYDSGVGTLYDLRHITAGIEPNRARWDYHTTHINLLLQLMIIDDDEIFKTVCHRWLGYLTGKRSRHN